MKQSITPKFLRQLFIYDPEIGSLRWRRRPLEHFADNRSFATWNKRFAGKEAGGLSGPGYFAVSIYGRPILKHRIIWAYVYGCWPVRQIDHINGCKTDNSISNLREVSHSQNGKNAKRPSHNTSGFVGVGYHAKTKKWRSYIKVNQKNLHLGLFSQKADAIEARINAEVHYGFHPNHGRA